MTMAVVWIPVFAVVVIKIVVDVVMVGTETEVVVVMVETVAEMVGIAAEMEGIVVVAVEEIVVVGVEEIVVGVVEEEVVIVTFLNKSSFIEYFRFALEILFPLPKPSFFQARTVTEWTPTLVHLLTFFTLQKDCSRHGGQG